MKGSAFTGEIGWAGLDCLAEHGSNQEKKFKKTQFQLGVAWCLGHGKGKGFQNMAGEEGEKCQFGTPAYGRGL